MTNHRWTGGEGGRGSHVSQWQHRTRTRCFHTSHTIKSQVCRCRCQQSSGSSLTIWRVVARRLRRINSVRHMHICSIPYRCWGNSDSITVHSTVFMCTVAHPYRGQKSEVKTEIFGDFCFCCRLHRPYRSKSKKQN